MKETYSQRWSTAEPTGVIIEWEEYRVSCFGRVAVCALLSPSLCVQHSYTLFLLHLNYCHPKRAPYVHVFSPK